MKLLFLGAGTQRTAALSRTINNFEFEQAKVKLNEIAELAIASENSRRGPE